MARLSFQVAGSVDRLVGISRVFGTEPKFDTLFAEDIPHLESIDVGKSSRRVKCDAAVFDRSSYGCRTGRDLMSGWAFLLDENIDSKV